MEAPVHHKALFCWASIGFKIENYFSRHPSQHMSSNSSPHALGKGRQAREATWGDIPSGAVLAALPLQLDLADHVALLQRRNLQGGEQSATVNLCRPQDSGGGPSRHVHFISYITLVSSSLLPFLQPVCLICSKLWPCYFFRNSRLPDHFYFWNFSRWTELLRCDKLADKQLKCTSHWSFYLPSRLQRSFHSLMFH